MIFFQMFPDVLREEVLSLALHPSQASPNVRLVSKYWKHKHDGMVTVVRLTVALAFNNQLSGCSTKADCNFNVGNMYATPWEVESLRAFPNLKKLHCELNVTSFDMSEAEIAPFLLGPRPGLFQNHMFPYSIVYSLRGLFPHLKVLDVQIVDESPPSFDTVSVMYNGVPLSKFAVSINTWQWLHSRMWEPDVTLFEEYINALPSMFGTQLETFHLPTIAMVSMYPHRSGHHHQFGPVFVIPQLLSVCAASRVSLCITFLAYETDVRHVQRHVIRPILSVSAWTILSTSEEKAPSYAQQYPNRKPDRDMLLWSLTFAGHL
jgi:hypothetical protein